MRAAVTHRAQRWVLCWNYEHCFWSFSWAAERFALFLSAASVSAHSARRTSALVSIKENDWALFSHFLIKRICQKMFPPNRSATNISVFKLLIFKVSHVLEDAVKAVCDYFPCRAALHTLPAPLSHPCSYILSTPQRFFSSSSSAHRLIHNLQGQFMRTHMFQPGALSRNAPQHVEKDTVPTSRLQIDYFDELLAAIFSKPCI